MTKEISALKDEIFVRKKHDFKVTEIMTTPAMLLDIVGQTRKIETERLLNLNARIIDLNQKGSSFALPVISPFPANDFILLNN